MVSQLQKTPTVQPIGTLETVAQFDGPMPTGVTVSHQGRIFVNFPKWGDEWHHRRRSSLRRELAQTPRRSLHQSRNPPSLPADR